MARARFSYPLPRVLTRIINGGRPPRSEPFRSRAMGLELEGACIFKW